MSDLLVCEGCQLLQVRARWTQGLDSCDWVELRSTLADEVYVDYSAWNGTPGSSHRADEWVKARKGLFPGLWASQHVVSNTRLEIADGIVKAMMYVTAEHILDDEGERWFTVGGIYRDEYEKTDGRWVITSMTMTPLWTRGDRGSLDEARKRAAAGTGPRC